MNNNTIIILGIFIGTLYYIMMKESIKNEHKNCSFVANKMTDTLAFIIGGILIHYGYNLYDDKILIIIGIAIITEHILQFSYKPLL